MHEAMAGDASGVSGAMPLDTCTNTKAMVCDASGVNETMALDASTDTKQSSAVHLGSRS